MAETTHLICAHCGGDVVISNREPPTAVLTLFQTSLAFNRTLCGTQYPLPVTVLQLDGEDACRKYFVVGEGHDDMPVLNDLLVAAAPTGVRT